MIQNSPKQEKAMSPQAQQVLDQVRAGYSQAAEKMLAESENAKPEIKEKLKTMAGKYKNPEAQE